MVQSYEREYANVTNQWSSMVALRMAGMVDVATALEGVGAVGC
jgi:hypothetical protein